MVTQGDDRDTQVKDRFGELQQVWDDFIGMCGGGDVVIGTRLLQGLQVVFILEQVMDDVAKVDGGFSIGLLVDRSRVRERFAASGKAAGHPCSLAKSISIKISIIPSMVNVNLLDLLSWFVSEVFALRDSAV